MDSFRTPQNILGDLSENDVTVYYSCSETSSPEPQVLTEDVFVDNKEHSIKINGSDIIKRSLCMKFSRKKLSLLITDSCKSINPECLENEDADSHEQNLESKKDECKSLNSGESSTRVIKPNKKPVPASLIRPSKQNSSLNKSNFKRNQHFKNSKQKKRSPVCDNVGYACSICAKLFNSYIMLNYHKRKEHSDLNIRHICQYCDKKFAVPIALDRHLKEYCMKIPLTLKRKLIVESMVYSVTENIGDSVTSFKNNKRNSSIKDINTHESALERLKKSKKSYFAGVSSKN